MSFSQRTCLGCATKAKKQDLVRLVMSSGFLVADKKQVLPGRGVYCCRNVQCYQRLVKQRKKLLWALRYQETERGVGLALGQELAAEFATTLAVNGLVCAETRSIEIGVLP